MIVAEISDNPITPEIFVKEENKARILSEENRISELLDSGKDTVSCLNEIFRTNKSEIDITRVLGLMLVVVHDEALTRKFNEQIDNWDFPGPDRYDVKVQREMMKKLWQATLLISEVGKNEGKLILAKKKISAAYNFVEGNNIGNIRQLGRSVFSGFAELVYDCVKAKSIDTGQMVTTWDAINWGDIVGESHTNHSLIL